MTLSEIYLTHPPYFLYEAVGCMLWIFSFSSSLHRASSQYFRHLLLLIGTVLEIHFLFPILPCLILELGYCVWFYLLVLLFVFGFSIASYFSLQIYKVLRIGLNHGSSFFFFCIEQIEYYFSTYSIQTIQKFHYLLKYSCSAK